MVIDLLDAALAAAVAAGAAERVELEIDLRRRAQDPAAADQGSLGSRDHQAITGVVRVCIQDTAVPALPSAGLKVLPQAFGLSLFSGLIATVIHAGIVTAAQTARHALSDPAGESPGKAGRRCRLSHSGRSAAPAPAR